MGPGELLGKLRLRGFGIVQAKQRHAEIIVGVRERRIQADGFAIIGSSVLKFSRAEESSAGVEADIGVVRLHGYQFLIGGDGVIKFVGG